mgnify:CR=1 FL=1
MVLVGVGVQMMQIRGDVSFAQGARLLSHDVLMHIHEHVGLVYNLLADQFLDDVFQSQNTNGAMRGTRFFANDTHVGFALLEIVQDIQARSLWRGFWQGGQGEMGDGQAIIRVVGDKDADQEHSDEVV